MDLMVVFSRMELLVVFLSALVVVAGGQEDLYGEYEQRVEVFITRYLHKKSVICNKRPMTYDM